MERYPGRCIDNADYPKENGKAGNLDTSPDCIGHPESSTVFGYNFVCVSPINKGSHK